MTFMMSILTNTANKCFIITVFINTDSW